MWAKTQFLVKPERREINDQLWDQPCDILFFAGHSRTEGEKGRIYINDTESLTIGELKYGLRKAIAQGLQHPPALADFLANSISSYCPSCSDRSNQSN